MMRVIKKSFIMLLILQALIFIGCGGGGSTPEKETPKVETLAQIETLDVNDTVSSGTLVGKVTIPTKSQDGIKKVELIGDGSKKFTISRTGEISTNTTLKGTGITSKSSTQKIEITNQSYIFKVKVTYLSGDIVYINIQITVYTYTETVEKIVVGEKYRQKIISKTSDATFLLVNPPEGMTINPKTGIISWTPMPNQIGEVSVDVNISGTIQTLSLVVESGTVDLTNAIFISPNGDNNNDGTYEHPLKDTKKLCTNDENILENKTLYY